MKITGVVTKTKAGYEGANPYAFTITDEEGNEYFCHLGDLKKNERKLYDTTGKFIETETLQLGDKVSFDEFTPDEKIRIAIRVEKKT